MAKHETERHEPLFAKWKIFSLASLLALLCGMTACNLFDDDEEDDDGDEYTCDIQGYYEITDNSAILLQSDFFLNMSGEKLPEPDMARYVNPGVEYVIRIPAENRRYVKFRFGAMNLDMEESASGFYEVSNPTVTSNGYYEFSIRYSYSMPSSFYVLIMGEDVDGELSSCCRVLVSISGLGGSILEGIGPFYKFVYDEHSHLVEVITYEGGSLKISYDKVPYFSFTDEDEEGNLFVPETTDFKRDSNGRIISYRAIYPNDDNYTTTLEYDFYGHVVADIQNYDSGYVDKYIFEWDKNGNLVKATDTGYDNGRVEVRQTYTYEYSDMRNKFSQPLICEGMQYSLLEKSGLFGTNAPAQVPSAVNSHYEYFSTDGSDDESERYRAEYSFTLNNYNELRSVELSVEGMTIPAVYVYGKGDGSKFDRLYPGFQSFGDEDESRAAAPRGAIVPFAKRRHHRR